MNGLGVRPFNGMELCAGIGALGLGVARAIPGYRTVVAAEIEAFAVAVLAARQQDGSLSPFPIWDDLTTFDGLPWRGVVDIVVAGFPCTDISLAGLGAGIHGERSGLFFDIVRIVRDVRPRYLFLENVAALTVRGLGDVLGALADIGFDAEFGCLRASDVGAPHGRNRWWCLAWDREQLADAGSARRREDARGAPGDESADAGWSSNGHHQPDGVCEAVADSDGPGLHVNGQQNGHALEQQLETPRRCNAHGCGQDVADAGHLQPQEQEGADGIDGQRPALGRGQLQPAGVGASSGAACRGDADRNGGHSAAAGDPLADRFDVADAADGRRGARVADADAGRGEPDDARGCPVVGDAGDGRRSWGEPQMGTECCPSCGQRPAQANGTTGPGRSAPFPPGPDDHDGWRAYLEAYPDLAPAIERPLRGSLDRSPDPMDMRLRCTCPRVDRLRALGNAVVPQQAEAALRLLWHRAFGEWLT